MSALFPRWTNGLAYVSLLALAMFLVGGLIVAWIYVRSPLFTQADAPVEQPIEFDHRHHAGDDAIDCRYCHNSVEKSPSAGIPATSVCMNCHSQLWNKSPLLDPVRQAYFTNRPLVWRRVHRLPDFVYFNHSIHVAKGVGCATCHGRVDTMAAVEQKAQLTMSWCLDCHRKPERFLRPREFITSMTWEAPRDTEKADALGRELVRRYRVHTRTSCTTCHR